ncbi:hypothetical protein G7Y89_g4005 [Cudoniella acicularis]|uniref:Protein kinase domain-containing protein n=1 Tax=Cudoniella acicularis TaxID=354080 RepID=A0A8H4W7V3_9HELO|nr:hypothetical protein G7Y89_g4005 [Cudoniella acicularis]
MPPNKGRRGGKANASLTQDTRAAEQLERLSKLQTLRDEVSPAIHKETIKSGTVNGTFISEASIQRIWTTERRVQLLEVTEITDSSFDKDAVLLAAARVQKHFKKIISILFDIGWDAWATFREIFWDLHDEDDEPTRSDESLPFTNEDLQAFLKPHVADKFETEQFKFIPVCIKAGTDNMLREGLILPLYEKKQIGKGTFGTVYKALVACRQFMYPEKGNALNTVEVPVAIKAFRFEDSFAEEVENLSVLRNALSEHSRILSSLATVSLGNQFYTLAPLADMDLDMFLNKTNTGFEITMANLIAEAKDLVDALDFLHTRIKISTAGWRSKYLACCHMDLKPDNILVFRHPHHPVGIWRITDFGISTIRENDFPLRNKGKDRLGVPTTVGMLTSSPQTHVKRGSGTYQAPEVNDNEGKRNVGRKSDIYSFACILTQVFAFGLGGKQELMDFDKGRRETGGGDDYFYKKSNSSYTINPHVKAFLDRLPEYKSQGSKKTETLNYDNAKDILLRMLNPSNPHSRPEAADAYLGLNAIFIQISKANPIRVNTRSRTNSSASLALDQREGFPSRPTPHTAPTSLPIKPIAPRPMRENPTLLEVPFEPQPSISISLAEPSQSNPSIGPPLSSPDPSTEATQLNYPGPSQSNTSMGLSLHSPYAPPVGLNWFQGPPTPGADTRLKQTYQPQYSSLLSDSAPTHVPEPPLTPPPEPTEHSTPSIRSNARSLSNFTKASPVFYSLPAPKSPTGVFISPSAERLVFLSERHVRVHSVNNKSTCCEITQPSVPEFKKWQEARVVDDYLFLKGRAGKPNEFDINLLAENSEKLQGIIHRVWFNASGSYCFAWAWAQATSDQFVYAWEAKHPITNGITYKHTIKDSDKSKDVIKGIISFPKSRAYIIWERDDYLSIIRSPSDTDRSKRNRTKIPKLHAVAITPNENMVVLVQGSNVSVSGLTSRVGDWNDAKKHELEYGFQDTENRSAVAVKNDGNGSFTVVVGHKEGKVEEIGFSPVSVTAQ